MMNEKLVALYERLPLLVDGLLSPSDPTFNDAVETLLDVASIVEERWAMREVLKGLAREIHP